jgi:ribonuclease P protein component
MIARKHRFHGHNSLNQVYRYGKTVRSEFVALRFAPSKKDSYRLAVVVSRKVSKSAVVRNRIRRRIYEIVRLYNKESGSSWNYDMVITVFDERIASIPYQDLQQGIIKLLSKANIQTPKS